MKRLLAIATVAAMVLSLGGTGTAAAHERRASFESKIRITEFLLDTKRGEPTFLGKIGSENPNCKPGRRGKILRRQPGDDELIGKGTSNNQGRFSVPVDGKVAFGRYYAKIGKDQIPAGTCKGDVSGDFELE